MNDSLDRYPALVLFAVLGLGILMAPASGGPLLPATLAVAGLSFCLVGFLRNNGAERLGLWLLVMALGAVSYTVHATTARSPWQQGVRYCAAVQVVSEPQQTVSGWRFQARVRSEIAAGGSATPRDFTVLAKLPDDPGWHPAYGDLAYVSSEFALAPARRNPGGFDYRDYLDHNEVAGIIRIEQAQFLSAGHGSWLVAHAIVPARRHVRRVIAAFLRGDEAALLSGLALGERNDLSKPVLEAFSDTGTTHVLAVSGLHVVLAAFIIFMLLRLLQLPKRAAGAGTIAGLVFYTLLTGGAPSITRATIMASAAIVGTLFERKGSGLNMLGLSALLILCCWPQALFDAGFQLSYAATFGILAMTRPIQDLLFKLSGNGLVREWLLLPLAVSVAAQLATAPVIAYHFHRIPMISLLANLVVVPLTNLLLAVGLCMALIGILSLWLIKPLAACAYVVSWLSLKAVALFAAVRFGTIVWPHTTLPQVLLYATLVVLAFRWRVAGRLRPVLVAAALLLLSVQVWQQAVAGPRGLRVTYLDVGQGDAALVEFPNGRRMLIDAGPAAPGYDAGERAVVPFLRGAGITSLDDILISHGDADHCGGLPYLLAHVKARRVVIAAYQPPQPLFDQGLALADARGVAVDTVRGYDTLDGIWPCRGYVYCRPDSQGDANEASLLAVISCGSQTFFFSGDMGPELERSLQLRGMLNRCTVLKVPHHGSRVNNTPEVIDALRPQLCVISVGERNRFGHPAPEVVSGYRAAGARVVRTDFGGAVTVTSDGRQCAVSAMADQDGWSD